MIKRPLNSRFSDAVLKGRKTTTIRDNPWPVGVPIMLYNWSGAAYRSKQIDVAPIVVKSVELIHITRRFDGDMIYSYGPMRDGRIHETEGFESRAEMDEWFRALVKPGQTVTKALMRFRLANAELSHSQNNSTKTTL